MNLTSLDRELERSLKRYNIAAHNYKLSNKGNRYTKKEAQTYIDCGKLQGFIFIAEPV